MKPGLAALLILATLSAGCASEPVNPNLAAPKVVVDRLPDGVAVVFVHSQFGERRYESIALRVDNETLVARSDAFSLEERVSGSVFYLEVEAVSGATTYQFRARFDFDAPNRERVTVSLVDRDGAWAEPRAHAIPYERILDRPEASA